MTDDGGESRTEGKGEKPRDKSAPGDSRERESATKKKKKSSTAKKGKKSSKKKRSAGSSKSKESGLKGKSTGRINQPAKAGSAKKEESADTDKPDKGDAPVASESQPTREELDAIATPVIDASQFDARSSDDVTTASSAGPFDEQSPAEDQTSGDEQVAKSDPGPTRRPFSVSNFLKKTDRSDQMDGERKTTKDISKLRTLQGKKVKRNSTIDAEPTEGDSATTADSTDGFRSLPPQEADVDSTAFDSGTRSEGDMELDDVTASSNRAFQKIMASSLEEETEDEDDTEYDDATEEAYLWYLNNANELVDDDRPEDAIPDYLRALELSSQVRPEFRKHSAEIVEKLGDIYVATGRPFEAVVLYEETDSTESIPPEKYIKALVDLGQAYEKHEDMEDAEVIYNRAANLAEDKLPDQNPLLERAHRSYVDFLRKKANTKLEAETEELETIRKKTQETRKAIIRKKEDMLPQKEEKEPTEDEKRDAYWEKKREHLIDSQTEKVELDKSAAMNIVVIVLTLGIVGSLVYFLTTKYGANIRTREVELHPVYVSADKRKVLKLQQGGNISMSSDGEFRHGSLEITGNGFEHVVSLLPGHLVSDYLFFTLGQDSIVDDAGSELFPEDSKEMQLVGKMWDYARLADSYRFEKHLYPQKNGRWSEENPKFGYSNPFTGVADKATIVGNEGSNAPGLSDKIASGADWKGQPIPRAGAIICNSFDGLRFFIRGYDQDNKFLTSAERGKCFYIELKDGKNVTRKKLHALTTDVHPSKVKKPLRVICSDNAVSLQSSFNLLKHLGPAALVLALLASLSVWKLKSNKGEHRPALLILAASIALLIVSWYAVAFSNIS